MTDVVAYHECLYFNSIKVRLELAWEDRLCLEVSEISIP